jgi:hypothetical protein
MKRNGIHVMLGLIAAVVFGLTGCSGGSGGGGNGIIYTAATSSSYSPTLAKDKATQTRNVPLHWVYITNNGYPVSASMNGVTVGVTVSSLEITLNPADLKRTAVMQGPVSGSYSNIPFGGSYSANVVDDLLMSGGKTTFSHESFLMNLTITAQGVSESAQANVTTKNITPPYEWFLDREDLGSLPTGSTFTNNCSGTSDVNISITGQSNIIQNNVPISMNDTWTILNKLPSMTIQGRTYNDVVEVSRQTLLPDLSGQMLPVTMYYWVAKGVGMIKGQGIYRILNIDDVVIELTDTNLVQ